MKRITPLLPIAILTLVLAACQDPAPRFDFEGVSLIEGVEYELTLSYERRQDRLVGDYTVDAARGSFTGALAGTTVTAELQPGPNCVYEFEGALTDDGLIGDFAPTGCPGGQGGTWTLQRR